MTAQDFEVADPFLEIVRSQVLEWQDRFVEDLISSPPETVDLNRFQLPTSPAPYFNCWADAHREDDTPYEYVVHQCDTDDYIYVSQNLVAGRIWFKHSLLTSDQLNRFQFSSLYTSDFAGTYYGLGGSDTELTRFECREEM